MGGRDGANAWQDVRDGHVGENASERASGASAADGVRGMAAAGAEGRGGFAPSMVGGGSEDAAKLIQIEESWSDDPAGEEGWGETVRRRAKYEGVVDAAGRTGGSEMKGWLNAHRRPSEGVAEDLALPGDLPVVGASASVGHSGHLPRGELGGAQGRGGETAPL